MKVKPVSRLSGNGSSPLPTDDRRREPRFSAAGSVRLYSERFDVLRLEGHLLDESESGFRLIHSDPSLPRNEDFRFEAAHLRGRARVVWNRILSAGHVESGFYVIERR